MEGGNKKKRRKKKNDALVMQSAGQRVSTFRARTRERPRQHNQEKSGEGGCEGDYGGEARELRGSHQRAA